MAVTAKALREKRFGIVKEARAFFEQHSAKQEDWTDDRSAQYDKMLAEAGKLEQQAKQIELLEKAEEGFSNPQRQHETTDDPSRRLDANLDQQDQRVAYRVGSTYGKQRSYEKRPAGPRGAKAYRTAFATFLAGGSLTGEQLAALRSDDNTKGGYMVASEQLAADILKGMDDMLYLRQHATVHTVREAKALGIRTRSAKMSTFAYTGEIQAIAMDSNLKVGKKVLTPHDLTGGIKVSRALMQSTAGAAEDLVRGEIVRDASEVEEQNFINGDGNEKPLGVFVASANGIDTDRDVITGSATSVTADALRNAKYALKAQHRANARWLVHRDFLSIVSKLKTSDNQYLWMPGLTEHDPDRMVGLPVMESEKVPNTFTNGLYVGVLGDFRYYEIADALDIEIQRLDELFALSNEIGFVGRLKNDGMPTLPEAFVRLKCST